MMLLYGLGIAIIVYTVVMVVNYKKHPKLSIATAVAFTATICQVCPDIVWIVLVVLTLINGQKQKALAAI